jgi:type II secretory pathway pseudopilin PulG
MTSVKCPQCGLTNWLSAGECKRCKFVFQTNQAEFHSNENASDGQNYNNPDQTAYQYSSPTPNFVPSNSNYGQNNNYQNYQFRPTSEVKSGLAIASMVLGILGFLTAFILIGLVLAPIGLILGIVALVKVKKKPHLYGGQGFAIAGVILSSLVVLILPIIAAIAIPNLLAARKAANEGAAISSLRTLSSAEQTMMSSKNGICGDLKELAAAKLIDPVMANGEKSGYRFAVINVPKIGGGCELHATPLSSSTGTRSFYFSTEDGEIRAGIKNGKYADKSDLPIR